MPAGAVAGRAPIIAYFLATDLIGLAFQWREGLLTRDAFIRAPILPPALLAGMWLGAGSFRSTDPAVFRKYVLAILAVFAILAALKGVGGLEYQPAMPVRHPESSILCRDCNRLQPLSTQHGHDMFSVGRPKHHAFTAERIK